MGIEDRFNRKSTNITNVISSETSDSLNSEAESGENMDTVLKRADVFLPPLDYSSASNFAIYGSAEKYYEDAVKRVYLEYPYDGSQNEISQYFLSSSFLDHYVLDKRYPRTNGYIILSADGWGTQVASSGAYGATATASYEYISLSGAPDTTLSSEDPIANAFSGSHNQNNIYDLSNNRGSNLRLNPASGSTVEFWLKKESFAPTKTGTEVIFDLWNYKDVNSVDYGRLRVEITGTVSNESPFRVTYISGTSSPTAPAGLINQIIGTNINTASVADNSWNHYAITFLSSSSLLTAKLYVNGDLNDTRTTGSTINEVTGGMVANIGALRTSPWAFGGTTYPTEGWGKLDASLDEFRYWKEARTPQNIGRNYWTQVRGGVNTDDANTTLGVYYKFNEGITDNSTLDSVVLDYSGRISNGSWTGYNTSARNTGSAMVSSSAASTEFLDPIIYSSHPEVSSLLSDLRASGSYYDEQNNSSIYNTLPAWITEDDNSGDLKNLVQIVASYFDRLQNQIREIPRLKNITYLSSSHSAPSFANALVRERGMYTPNMFIDANILEEFLSRDEDREYNLDFREIKNRIYQNIYNNLIHINKSKGTENAYRNLIHCYGVDEELVRLNVYGNNVTYELKDNFRSAVVSKNLVDFNSLSRNDATIYQMTASSNSNSVSFISGTADSDDLGKEDYLGFTLESEMLFPAKGDICASTSSVPGNIITTVSLYGMHSADGSDAADTTWPTNDYADLRVQALRADDDSPDVRFRLTSSVATFPTLTSSLYKDVYDNNKWNFAVRVFNEKYPLGDVITGVSTSGSIDTATRYKIEFFGINSELDIVRNEFLLTGTLPNQGAVNLLRSDKRVFAGAHRTNFTGNVLQSSDIKLSAIRYWADVIPDGVIRAHSRDPENYGTLNPYRNAFASQTSMTGTYIPEIETLALNWSFENVTGSDADGFISVEDFSSGSTDLQSRYGWYGNIAKAQHTAKGQFFPALDTKSVDKNYLNAARQSLPEVVQSSQMVSILNQDEESFDRDQRPVSHFLSVEKSMYQVISDQMLQSFATIVEFDNLIGDPVNRYRQDYKLMDKARALFFANIQNTPDLDKFIDFYKWIDSSLSIFMQQLAAASADTSEDIRNLVESHVLERNKYWSKFPTLERKEPSLEGSMMGAGATRSSPPRARNMLNPVLGRAPIPYVQNKHAPYWKTRAARDETGGLATGVTAVDNDRQTIFESLKSQYDRDKKRPFVFNKDQVKIVHGGTNYSSAKRRDLIFNATAVYGPRAVAGMPLNTVLMDDVDVLEFQNIDDVTDPNEKRKYSFRAKLRREDEAGSGQDNATYSSQLKGDIAAPFNLVSGTVTTGYNSLMVSSFKTGTILTNLHSDTYGNSNEVPMQGPFAEAHVGGHQSRHISINRYDSTLSSTNNIDAPGNRPEAWLLFLGTRYGGGWGAGGEGTIVGFVGPDYPYPGGPYPYTANEFATRYRNVGAKRPVNIRNISYTTASTTIGNYRDNYEVVQTSARSVNNKYFVDNEGITLPSTLSIKEKLPQTNVLSTLLGINVGTVAGNVFGTRFNSVDDTLDISARYEVLAQFGTIIRTGSATKSIFVNRFSAPGGPEVNTLGYLDITAAEKSVYNAMTYRNLSVRSSGSGETDAIRVQDQINERRGLRTLLSDHSGKFGHDKTFGSISSDVYVAKPSYHKINRNTLKRVVFSGTGENQYGEAATGSFRDNAFVSHEIPRTDLQYSWITASYEVARINGHAWNDSVVSSSAGVAQAIDFASASIVTADSIQVDFANLNTLVKDDINITTSIASSSAGDHRNTDLATINVADTLNALNSHRNGAYGYSSWKQIRGGETAVARKQREKNIISHVAKNNFNYPLPVVESVPEPRFGTVKQFVEPPIVTKFSPIRQNVNVKSLTDKGIETEESADFYSSYANSLHAFNSPVLNNEYGVNQQQAQAYDRLRDLYADGADLDDDSPVNSFNFITYGERVYPASRNVFSSSVRGRPEYANNFWRDIREDRTQTNQALLASASIEINGTQGSSENTVTQSMWSLDADEDFLTRKMHGRVTSAGGPGILQNSYCQIHSGNVANITASVQYARRHTVDFVHSVVSSVGALPDAKLPGVFFDSTNYLTTFSQVAGSPEQEFGGQALWDAPGQAGKNPWYNSYDDYINNMRSIGKDYSVVPEFRISDHIKYYMSEKGGNFLADNASIFNMSGGLSDRDVSSEENFYTTYTNSDFLKFFDIVRDEHADIANPSNITLQCSALLKFLPYDGFYPAARTAELGRQFSASYGPAVRLEGTHATGSAGMKAFMAPFYAPGLMYNTIKSGIAVDYPMMSASLGTHGGTAKVVTSHAYISGSAPNAGRFHYRIPFEALIEPEKYISDKDIIDLEPHPSCAINITASWDGRGDNIYKMMASNFFAEVPEFFLPEQQFSSLVSKPEKRFESVKSGEQYGARFKIYKSLNVATWRTGTLGYRNPFIPRDETDVKETFTMYSRPSAFGPPVGGGANRTQLTSGDGINPPFTPPYYYGEAWADLFFTAPRTSTTENPITLEEIFSPANLAVSYKRIGDTWKSMNVNTIMHLDNVEYNAMQVDASFNLFGKAQIKNLTYDPISGEPLVASDSDESVWVIQPKFETPMLNFQDATRTLPTYGSASVAYGMWHQYGVLPDDPSKGIFFQIGDIPENYIENALNGSPASTGSLVDLVGFSSAPRRLGSVSDAKIIREAVVAIPFVEQSGERSFFSIAKERVSEALGEFRSGKKPTNGSIASMIDSMTRYVFPPALDFITNPEAVDPYAAYIFEFEQMLNQDDLVDIWQNLAPRSAFSFDPESQEFVSGNGLSSEEMIRQVSISHPLLASELLDSDVPSRVQWMVFKVKQRANKNYFSKIIADEVNQVGNFDRTVAVDVGRRDSGKSAIPDYSYNWPYDFFSLVELVKIDAEITIEGNSADPSDDSPPVVTTGGMSRE
jgi:hypothetical protein